MNPFLKWVTAHRHAQAAHERGAPGLPTARRCPNCHRAQAVQPEHRDDTVRCDGCGVPIPPGPPGSPGAGR